jgi:hypothetical protein
LGKADAISVNFAEFHKKVTAYFEIFDKVGQSVDHKKPSRSDEFWALSMNGINISIATKDALGMAELIYDLC